tara:strand:+ start:225 stop:434 length:210 start_codon:yes stop_codon:yes gene_type:complete
MEDFITELELEVSELIRKKLETTKDFNFALGNDLDILINDHVDIKYVCYKAEQLCLDKFKRADAKREIA